LGWATIAAAVSSLAGASAGALGEAYDRSSDLGTAVADLLSLRTVQPDPEAAPTLREVADAFAAIEVAPGSVAKAAVFAAILGRCDPLPAKYVVKILTGELRIGLREGLLEAAIAQAFDRPQSAVSWAGMLTGDMGETAVLAKEGRLDEARLRLFHPLRFMLASPSEDAAEIMARLGPQVWVEDKYDGIRAQLHRRGSEVRLYSRELHDISEQFPEIVDAAGGLPWDGILDGEILAYAGGRVLPFLTLQARLGRKDPGAQMLSQVPVIYVAFDVLAVGPRSARDADATVEPLLQVPLVERRARLEALDLPRAVDGGSFALSHLVTADSVAALDRVFTEARARRNEGLMVKDPASAYSPGRRGLGWLKMKRALATIDCVVVGVEVGHGKRHAVLSDYTFAVRDEATERLVTIGKAYTGLTDAEISEMTAWFEANTLRRLGRFRQVEPTVVVEVAFDVIQRSTRHQSGFALRFPRIVRIRTDKGPGQIDTLQTVERLYRELQDGAEYLVTANSRRPREALPR
jgi:DNA ligase-1